MEANVENGMSALTPGLERLLQEISPDQPCGEDLVDSDMPALERAARPRWSEEKQVEVDPEWRIIKEQASSILVRSKDLRAAAYLGQAMASLAKYQGICEALGLLRGVVAQFWECAYPQINDQNLRVKELEKGFGQHPTVLKAAETSPLVYSLRLARDFSLKDLEETSSTPPGGKRGAEESPTQIADIEAAFSDAFEQVAKGNDETWRKVTETSTAVDTALEHLAAIEALVKKKSGTQINFEPLRVRLFKASQLFLAQRAKLEANEETSLGIVSGTPAAGGAAQAQEGAEGALLAGELSSRRDVERVLDSVCAYFERNEPSSPVPLLLKRAKRLVSKSFLEIIQDVAPSGLRDVEVLKGPDLSEEKRPK